MTNNKTTIQKKEVITKGLRSILVSRQSSFISAGRLLTLWLKSSSCTVPDLFKQLDSPRPPSPTLASSAPHTCSSLFSQPPVCKGIGNRPYGNRKWAQSFYVTRGHVPLAVNLPPALVSTFQQCTQSARQLLILFLPLKSTWNTNIQS